MMSSSHQSTERTIIDTEVVLTGPTGLSSRVARAWGRTKRAWLTAPIVRQRPEARYQAQLEKHATQLPVLTADRDLLLERLRRDGIAECDATAFLAPEVVEAADRFAQHLQRSPSPKRSIRLSPDDIASAPEMYKWGLNAENLDLAENYIGLPVHYRGPDVKRETVDNALRGVRQWHKDVDDRRMLKLIVYLSAVDDTTGPFEYVDLSHSIAAAKVLHYKSGFVSDDAMSSVVPKAEWLRATGPRLWAIFVDTSRIFHRVRPPITAERYSMTFSYSSETPFQLFPEHSLSRLALEHLRSELTPRQWRASINRPLR